jgi:hypothetical protein
MKAIYTSVWDDGDVTCESSCEYDPDIMRVSDIETAENAEDADDANALTDEFITLPDGTELRESDGITFEHKED